MNTLESSIIVEAPKATLFEWYANPANAIKMTPPDLHLKMIEGELPLRQGSRVLFSTRPTFIPFEVRWLFCIDEYLPGQQFVEVLQKGPFEHWRHSHHFQEIDEFSTRVTDKLEFDQLQGVLRALIPMNLIIPRLEQAFRYREKVLGETFNRDSSRV